MKRFMMVLVLFVFALASNAWAVDPLVFMPFSKNTSWYCTQGPGGAYSHFAQPTYYGYDWNKGTGASDSNNPAFGQNIYSPVKGTVKVATSNFQDFVYNDKNYDAGQDGHGRQHHPAATLVITCKNLNTRGET